MEYEDYLFDSSSFPRILARLLVILRFRRPEYVKWYFEIQHLMEVFHFRSHLLVWHCLTLLIFLLSSECAICHKCCCSYEHDCRYCHYDKIFGIHLWAWARVIFIWVMQYRTRTWILYLFRYNKWRVNSSLHMLWALLYNMNPSQYALPQVPQSLRWVWESQILLIRYLGSNIFHVF